MAPAGAAPGVAPEAAGRDTPPAAGACSRAAIWRSLPWLGGLFITAIVVLAAIDIWRGHVNAGAETTRELDALSRVIAEQTVGSMQTIDRMLQHVVEEGRTGKLDALWHDEAALHEYLRNQIAGLSQVAGLSMIDAEGRILASSSRYPQPDPRPSVAAMPAFQQLKAARDGGVLVADTMRGVNRPDVWIFPIGRRLETRDGHFAGAVAAAGRVDYFQDFYRVSRLDEGTAITLMHRDGTVLARYPVMPAVLGKRYPGVDAALTARAEGRPTAGRGISPFDGADRFGAVQLLTEYPLAVVVTRDAAVALAGWRRETAGTVARTLALALLATGLLVIAQRQLRRLERSRASLAHSRERFELAAAGSDEGIWDWDVATDRIYASARAREIYGLPPGPEVQSRDAWFAALRMNPADVAARREALQAHLAGKTPVYAGEYRVRDTEGRERWVRVRGLCVRDAHGVPQRMAGSVTDIDARKRAEDALRVSEERYALAMTGSTGGHWVWEPETDALFVSGTVNELFGLPAGTEPTSRSEYFERIRLHADDKAAMARIDRDVRDGSASRLDFEFRVLPHGSTEPRWILTRAQCFRDEAGRALRVAGVSVDITERKRTEEALRASEQRFALAVAGSDDGVWDFDYVADRVFASRRCREILGISLQPETQSFAEWFAEVQLHPEDAAARMEAMQGHLDGRLPAYEGEWRVRQHDGHFHWVRVRGVCVRDEQGKPLRMAGSVTDIDARKRAEELQRRSEERYALAVAGSDDGVWDWDFRAGMAFESARARELQGLPPGPEVQPLLALIDSLRVHPDDAPRRAEGLRAHLAGETPAYECEYRVRHGDGEYRWIRVRALCVRDEQAMPIRMAGSVSDIDARKRAEQALRESEQRFAHAVAGANDGILDWDIVADRMFASDRAMRMVGLEPDDQGRTRAEWAALVMPRMHPEDVPRLKAELRGSGDSPPEAHEGEYRVRGADGEYRWMRFRGRLVRDASGRAVRWAGSVSDVDALKKTEEALRRSEQRYQLAVDGSNEGLWDWDLVNDTLFLSPRAQQLVWQRSGEPLRPRREWIAITDYHPDDVPLVRTALSAHLRGAAKHFKVEYRLRHHGGEWRWYRQRGIAVRDANGRPTRMAGSMEDITDRKQAEAERERLEQQLRQAQKLEAIGTLAGGIAHDFNNILAAILGYGEMVQRDAPEGTAVRRNIDAAMSAGMRAKSLVERILAFSRSGMGERVPVHVQSVVGEALDAVVASLPAGVNLERRLDCGNAAVLGDPTQVHQVVLNLCANAVQAMKSSGTLSVTLELAQLDSPRCATSVLADGSYVRLSVRDTGVGIEPQLLERIFDPFFTTKEVGVGTGLGLSLVHGIVADLGGGIEVDSAVGEGSTFNVYLPWSSCVEPAVRVEEAMPPGQGQTVLLVDDEEALVRLGEEMIASLGYEPVGFTSSVEALETFRAAPERFDIVLSDEAMPGMTGSELALTIRAIRADIPIVLMSGYVTPTMTRRAREAGVAEVLSKPLVALDIARSLAGALQAPAG